MPLTVNLEKLWNQRYEDNSVPFPVDGSISVDGQVGSIGASVIDASQAPYSAKGDERLAANGAMTSGSNILTGSGFTSADVGKTVTVWVTRSVTDLAWTGSGNQVTSATANFTSADVGKRMDPWGGPSTTIASVQSTTAATLAAPPDSASAFTGKQSEISAGLISTVSSLISSTQVHLAANWTQTTSVSSANYSVATDDSAAFTAAIAACAAAGGGTVTAPAKVYRLQEVYIPSDVIVEFPAGTTIKMAKYTVGSPGLFHIATRTNADTTFSSRSGIRGRNGFVTLDMSDLQQASSAIRGIYVNNAIGYLVENIRGVGLPANSGNVVHLHSTSALTTPTDGVIRRIRNEQVRHTGNSCIQVDAAFGLRVDALWCDGGVALRIEDSQHDGDIVENVSASRIRAGGESGQYHSAIITNAHENKIRNVTVDGFRAVGGANGHTVNYGKAGSSSPNLNAQPMERIAVRGGLVEGGGSGVANGAPFDSGVTTIQHDQCVWQDIKVIGAVQEGFRSSGGTYITCTAEGGAAAGWVGLSQSDGVANPQNPNPPQGIITRLYGCVAKGNLNYGYNCQENQLWEFFGCSAFDVVPTGTSGSNLLSSADADVESGLGTWANLANATVTQSTDQAQSGTHCVKVVATAAGALESRTASGTNGFAVTPGTIYKASAYVRAATAAANVFVSLRWYTSGGAFISQQAGSTITDATNAWKLVTATLTAPATAAFGTLKLQWAAAGASEAHYSDNHSVLVTTAGSGTQNYGINAASGQIVNVFGGDFTRNLVDAYTGAGTVNVAVVTKETQNSTLPFVRPGNAVAGSQGTWRAPVAGSVVRVSLRVTAAPAGSDLAVQFRLNGTSFQTLTITDGTTTAQTAITGQDYLAGDLLDINATSIGSGTPAQNVVAQFDYAQTVA